MAQPWLSGLHGSPLAPGFAVFAVDIIGWRLKPGNFTQAERVLVSWESNESGLGLRKPQNNDRY